jgi:eukaryotic-like serine/threonine-protein kinase
MSAAQALRIFEAALDCPVDQRAAFVQSHCGDDVVVKAEVEKLLRAHELSTTFLDPVATPNVESTSIGPYQLRRRIGGGGMGEVWLAERADGAYRGQVAIKLMHGHLLDEALKSRALAERQFLAELRHPNIARLLDAGSTQSGQLYVVMEYIDGLCIDDFARLRRLDVRQRVQLFLQVLSALDAAHRQLIIHRDLKAANILVGADGEAKLLDFGIAKSLTSIDGTHPALLMLTPSNASPEQLLGKTLGTATDIYSAATVLFQLLAGQLPREFEAERSFAAAVRLAETRPPSLTSRVRADRLGLDPKAEPQLRQLLRGDLEAILAKALRFEPSARYGSVREFADDLNHWLHHRPVQARHGGRWYTLSRFVARYRWPLLATSAAATAVLIGLGLAWHQSALRLQEAERTELVQGFLADMISKANPFTEGGEQTVAQALDEASKTVSERFGSSPQLEAEVRQLLGRAYLGRNELDPAQTQLEAALRLLGETCQPLLRSQILANLAQLNWLRGQVDAAALGYIQASELLDLAVPAQRYQHTSNLNDLAQLYSDRGEVQKAIETAQASWASWRLDPEKSRESLTRRAVILSTLGYALHGDPKRLADAAEHYRRSIDAQRELAGEDTLDIAVAQNNEASARLALGQPKQAIALMEASIRTRERLLPAKHWMRVMPYANLAKVYAGQQQPERACELLKNAFDNAKLALTAADPTWLRLYALAVDVAEHRADPAHMRAMAERALANESWQKEIDPERISKLKSVVDQLRGKTLPPPRCAIER